MWLDDDSSGGPARRCVMSAQADRSELSTARRRRLVGLGLLRALATTVVLVALYYLLPLDHIKNVPLTLVAGMLILLAAAVWQVRAIIRARYPALRAVEALAVIVPLFLLLFASAYFTMAGTNPANFHPHSLTRTDALYFDGHHIQHRRVRGYHCGQPDSQDCGHRPDPARPAGSWAWASAYSWELCNSPGSRQHPANPTRASRHSSHHSRKGVPRDRRPDQDVGKEDKRSPIGPG